MKRRGGGKGYPSRDGSRSGRKRRTEASAACSQRTPPGPLGLLLRRRQAGLDEALVALHRAARMRRQIADVFTDLGNGSARRLGRALRSRLIPRLPLHRALVDLVPGLFLAALEVRLFAQAAALLFLPLLRWPLPWVQVSLAGLDIPLVLLDRLLARLDLATRLLLTGFDLATRLLAAGHAAALLSRLLLYRLLLSRLLLLGLVHVGALLAELAFLAERAAAVEALVWIRHGFLRPETWAPRPAATSCGQAGPRPVAQRAARRLTLVSRQAIAYHPTVSTGHFRKTLVRLLVNGEEHTLAVPVQRTLLEALRYELGLTGSK